MLNFTDKRCILFFMKGKELKIKRIMLDLTQAQLAGKLELNTNTISRYEQENLPIPKTVELAIEALENREKKEERDN